MHRALLKLLVATLLVIGLPGCSSESEDWVVAGCTRSSDPSRSVARVWDEVLLDGIRRDFPAPTIHSRNLFHLSAAMWDAWAAYDDDAVGHFVEEQHTASDVGRAREAAISFAAYRILSHRYAKAFGADETLAELDETMAALCYAPDYVDSTGSSPAALGNRVAATVIELGTTDGSNEADGYASTDYESVNPPLILTDAGTTMSDPNRWQPLAFEVAETQNGIQLAGKVQKFVGPFWGSVAPFALPLSDNGLPIDPGMPPHLGDPGTDDAFKQGAAEVIEYGATLDPSDGVMIDISPASYGNNPLGTYDGTGYELNPITGLPYEPNIVARGDFGRVLAEFWADGPNSETPPGHWNSLANSLVDDPDFERRVGGVGDVVDPLEWDVKLYIALNGALHDAAIAAWGAKGHYDYVRPISMIRYMGGLGQSSDPNGASYDPGGLPLIPGLIELVTEESSAPGERHEYLDRRVGSVAVRAWAGNPGNLQTTRGGVTWIRAVRWMPYQRATFVTPAFAGYVSGHSTFSRAAAEVLAAFTGSEYFPGGLGEWTIEAGDLEFEAGPDDDVTLQWATYFDAADQAGISRLYGGIHVRADDLAGRVMGAACGRAAWALAQKYFDGSVSG